MYIEELILDGFKSYAGRTVVGGWDSAFTAITGLNGSGKSNLLDAICFVLGISTLAHVRAANLLDLVYKRGQAGVARASVSVVFNNSNKDASPPGFQAADTITVTRQVIVGGSSAAGAGAAAGCRNKYLVNGINKSQHDVASLFQSVQLNVNNPHFLIMQGKITKVLNMKPPEILSMVQEAAGTRMFEEHKDRALKTIDKKDAKLAEISDLLESEIAPKLDHLREDRRVLLEYQKVDAELAQLLRLVVAYDHHAASNAATAADTDLAAARSRSAHLSKVNELRAQEIADIDERLAGFVKDRLRNSSSSARLDADAKTAADALVKVSTQLRLKNESIADELSNISNLKSSLAEALAAAQAARQKEADLADQVQTTLVQNEAESTQVRKLEELLQTLTTGLASTDGGESGFLDQLQEARRQLLAAAAEAQQIQIRTAYLTKEIAETEPKARAAKQLNSGLLNELAAAGDVVQSLSDQLASLSWDPAAEGRLVAARKAARLDLDRADAAVRSLENDMSGLTFSYSDPVPNFDRSKVKGLVAELVNVSPEYMEAATALEVCAGGRLYNVVVSDEVVGTQLLERGKLRRRVTIIPLNKIVPFRAQAERVATAKRLAPGKVDLALNLVGSDAELSVVMEYVFGGTLVCKDAATAKTVTFDNAVRLRSVTNDGDLYDPSGQLTGGARASTSREGVLAKVQRLRALRTERNEAAARLAAIEAELDDCLRSKDIINNIQQRLDLKTHEKKALEARLSANPNEQLVQHLAELRREFEKMPEALSVCRERETKAQERCTELEREIKELSNNRGSKLASIRKQIADGKKRLAKAQPTVNLADQQMALVREELQQRTRETNVVEEQIVASQQQLAALEAECAELVVAQQHAQARYDEAQSRLDRERASLASFDKKIGPLEEEKRKRVQETEDAKLELQTLQHDIAKLSSAAERARRTVAELESEHVWITDQSDLFGQPGTAYDFSQYDFRERRRRLGQLQEQHASMLKTVDPQVLEKYARIEKKEGSLKLRLATVKKDKKKIQQTLTTLEDLKREKLVETWTKVSRDFGLIFGDLLPGGNTCKLEAPEGEDITDGLEVKVCLGGKWKHSLTELSGGQRSLIALALILSLLQFKPAPMYILDEVDSALDLSHTQNIGRLLKTRFRGSQFIVVSLKDGMFNNANVLFRTKFVDGVSKVDRIAARKAVGGGNGQQCKDDEEGASADASFMPASRPRTPTFLRKGRQSVLTEMHI